MFLPFEAAFDHPGEDAGEFVSEFVGQLGVRFGSVEALRKRDQADPVPNGIVGALDYGLVVGREPQLELWLEVEVLPEQESGGDGITAGELLDLRLGEPPSLLHLRSRYEPGALQSCYVVADALVLLDQESLDVGVAGIIAEDFVQQLHKRSLAVLAESVKDG